MKETSEKLSTYNVAVTGTSKGIGEQLVIQFINDPSCQKIYCFSRHHDNLKALPEAANKCIPIKLDLKHPESIDKQISNSAIKKETKLNFLVNNAGFLSNKPFTEYSYDEMLAVFAVNYFAPLALIHQLVPKMELATQRHIINIGSMAGVQGSVKFPGLVHYGGAKGALATATEILARELEKEKVSINCLALGSVETEMFSEAFPGAVAHTNAETMARHIYNFLLNGYKVANGKIFPLSLGTP